MTWEYWIGLLVGLVIAACMGAIYEAWQLKKLYGWKYNWRIWIPFWYVEWQYSRKPDDR